MENIERELKKERKIIHEERKILRTRPLVLLRKYLLLVAVVVILALTTILGIYNIRNIDFVNTDNKYVRESDIRNLLNNGIVGKNFFLINPVDVEEIISANPYVKSVKVEKVFPDTLDIDIEEYIPFIVFETTDTKCKVFSKEGELLETKEETECDEFASSEKAIYFTGDDDHIVDEDGKENFYLADDINSLSKILKEFDISIITVNMKNSVLDVITNSPEVILDTNQDIITEFSRLYLVLTELKKLERTAVSVDVRFERPVLVIDN